MNHVEKRPVGPLEQLHANGALRGMDWVTFKARHAGVYTDMHQEAMTCQYGEDAYTGELLSGDRIHFDHYRKKAIYNESRYVFGWDNLFLALHNPKYGADYKDNFIHGPRAQSDLIYSSILSPIDLEVRTAFYCSIEGRLHPSPEAIETGIEAKVLKTIEVFNLNHPILMKSRASLMSNITGMLGTMKTEELDECGYTLEQLVNGLPFKQSLINHAKLLLTMNAE